MSIRPTNFNSCSWPWTVVCGADDTARERFAHEFALRHGGHVVDTGDLLTGVRALTGAQTHPELFYADAEDHRGFLPSEGVGPSTRVPLPGTPAELAAARMRAADALDPAVHKLIGKQPRVRDEAGWGPHPIFSGRFALPTQGHDFAVLVTVTAEQVMENLQACDPRDGALEQRVETALLVQEELRRRAAEHRKGHCYVYEAPFGSEHGSVEALYQTMDDAWDAATALGGMW
jgi:hypothetical protein